MSVIAKSPHLGRIARAKTERARRPDSTAQPWSDIATLISQLSRIADDLGGRLPTGVFGPAHATLGQGQMTLSRAYIPLGRAGHSMDKS
jgi:hypothetical protein